MENDTNFEVYRLLGCRYNLESFEEVESKILVPLLWLARHPCRTGDCHRGSQTADALFCRLGDLNVMGQGAPELARKDRFLAAANVSWITSIMNSLALTISETFHGSPRIVNIGISA